MSTNAYQDINGRWHAPLMNAYNSYCWYITGLQRLQCSPALASILSDPGKQFKGVSSSMQPLMAAVIEPIKIMNKLNGKNGKEVVDELRKYFETHADVYRSTDGFSSNIYLSKYILPIVYNLTGGDNGVIIKIMKEIGMDSASIYVANEVISNDKIPILNASEEEEFRDSIYAPFHDNFIRHIQRNPFKAERYASADVELWSATNSGHVIPIIQQPNGTWIVFDDHRFVGDLKDYLSQPYNFHKVKFSLTDKSFKQYVRGEIDNISAKAKDINDFTVTESLVYLTLTNRNSTQVPSSPLTMAGGDNGIKNMNYINKVLLILGLIAIILAIVLISLVKQISCEISIRDNALNASV
jgi:spore maturation protein SpmB